MQFNDTSRVQQWKKRAEEWEGKVKQNEEHLKTLESEKKKRKQYEGELWVVLWNSVNTMQADFDTQTRLGQCLYPCPHVVCVHSVGQWWVYTYEGVQALVMHFDPTYVHLHAKL